MCLYNIIGPSSIKKYYTYGIDSLVLLKLSTSAGYSAQGALPTL